MYWTTGSGRIELNITKNQAAEVAHPGQCDADIERLMQNTNIRRQLQKICPKLLSEELLEYGAWNEDQIADHEENLNRILWIACGDILEEV
jgi:hypothetical protein